MNLKRLFSHEINFDLAMKPFSWQHGLLITLALLSIFFTLKYAKSIKNSSLEKKFKIAFAIWIFLLELIYHIHYWMHGLFSIPIHMCSIGAFFSIYLLLTDSKKAYQVLFLIGITGGLTALLVPDTLGYTYFNIRYYLFPIMHLNILIVPIYYYKAYGYRLSLKYVYITFGIFVALLPIANYMNKTYDRNYLFIGQQPKILGGLLPGWPYYFIIGVVGLFIVFHILYYLQNVTFDSVRRLVELKSNKESE